MIEKKSSLYITTVCNSCNIHTILHSQEALGEAAYAFVAPVVFYDNVV